ncbi:MAG: SDR family NAD(P)-dependent oxidoreductase [Mycobacteriaceae bacterium]
MSEQASTALSFEGRQVVVTGGAHGIGAATAELLRALGATVLVIDIAGGDDDLPVDLADPEAVTQAAVDAQQRLGGVDVLVNCAGISRANALRDLDRDAYHLTLAVNLHAPILLMHAFSNCMAEARYGRIVNVTSIHARFTEPGSLAYDVSKAGLESATRTAAIELASAGILVNAVAPGFVDTRMAVVDGQNELDSPQFRSFYLDQGRLPVQRAAAPEEVAQAIAWLASSANTYTTGQSLVVDGGLTARF